jgi:hypothetical protein
METACGEETTEHTEHTEKALQKGLHVRESTENTDHTEKALHVEKNHRIHRTHRKSTACEDGKEK